MTSILKIKDKIMGVQKTWRPHTANLDNSIQDSKRVKERNEMSITERQQAEAALKESEEKFSKAFRSSPDAIAITTLEDGKFIEVNDSYTRITGHTRQEVIGHTARELGDWANTKERDRVVRLLKEQGRVHNEEVHLRRQSGETSIALFSAEPINIDGEPCMISIARDITERKRAEEALRESEEFSTSLLENAPNPITVINPDTSVKYVNPAFEKLTGFSLAEIAGTKAPYLWWPEERRPRRLNGLKEFLAGGSKISRQTIQNRNGELFLVEMNMVRVMHNGEFRYYLAHWNDITERSRTEEALGNEASRRRILMEQSRDGIVILDQNGKVYEANRQFAEMLGYSPEEVLQLDVWDWEFQFPREQVLDMIRSIDENGDHFETQHRRKDGTIYDVEISTNGAVFAGQKLVFCVCRDITERKKTEEALIKAEGKYRDLLDNTNELIQSVTPDGRFRYVNKSWLQTLGYSEEEISNLNIFRIIHPDYLEHYQTQFMKIMSGKEIGPLETAFVSKNGNKVIVEGNVTCKYEDGKPVYTRGIYRDITSSKYLEEQMFRLSSAVSMSTDCIVITDSDARIIDVNRKYLEMYGANSKDELIGRHFLELIVPAGRVIVNNDIKELLEKGYLECREYHMRSKQGQEFPVKMSTSLVRAADGKPMGIVRVGSEVSNQNNQN
jgi:PAS domain S-box-containing protein